MMRMIILILSVVSVFSCHKKDKDIKTYYQPPVDSLIPSRNDTAKTYLALGDSYTIGQSVTEHERFPAQTVALAKQQGIKMADPIYIATTGWTSEDLQTAIVTRNPSTADVVSLLIGVNGSIQRDGHEWLRH